jgi:outer membrane protein assembly factor BamC
MTMQKYFYRLFVIFSLIALIAGCGALSQKSIEYKSAGKLPSLEVPPDLTAPNANEKYQIPDTNPKASATFSTYQKEQQTKQETSNTGLLPSSDKARVERAGTQRWLVVQGNPDNIWPVVKEFWQELGFIINLEIPEAGIMETDWAENRAKIPQDGIRNLLGKLIDSLYSTAERDKFRTRLERGAAGTTEIYISHRGVEEVYEGKEGRTVWQPRPADAELEAEMLRRLMVRFGVKDAPQPKSILAADTANEHVKLLKSQDGTAKLSLDDPFDRAWRRVGLALDRIGFTVEDRDRSKGIYYIRYVDPGIDKQKEEKSVLSKLAFWRSDADPKKQEQYQLLVKGSGDVSEVQVINSLEKAEIAGKILDLLRDQLK